MQTKQTKQTQDKVFCTINTERVTSTYREISKTAIGKIIPLTNTLNAVINAIDGSGFIGLLEARADFRMVISGYIPFENLEGVIERLNANLKQDCCAVEVYHALDTYTALVGPNTEPYGAFNYDYFLHRGATDSPSTAFKLGGA